MTATLARPAVPMQVFQTDWLASRPVFYNEQTGAVSHNVNDVIDFANLELDPEGLANFLRFGFSVFGQTPIRGVRVLPPCTRLTRTPAGRLATQPLPDPVDAWLGRTSHETDVLEALAAAVQAWEARVAGDIIIPTSGGFDSRLLNLLIHDRRRILSFTYGLSRRQEESLEVVHARELAARLGTRWRQIPLGGYHAHLDEWDALYGVATHAHGMYQLEFYHALAAVHPGPLPVLSGIIGDAWAGAFEVAPVTCPADLAELAHTHGAHADPAMSLLPTRSQLATEYFERHRARLADPRVRIVEAMRLKLILLSYLLRVPEHVGYRAWSPFLEPDLALAMLTLPSERRRDRRWQRDFFARQHADLESARLPADRRNTLNEQALGRVPLPPLDVCRLREVVRPDYVLWINRTVARSGRAWDLFWRFVQHRRWGKPLRRRGVRDRRLEAYFAYLTLRPIENVLRRRDHARRMAG